MTLYRCSLQESDNDFWTLLSGAVGEEFCPVEPETENLATAVSPHTQAALLSILTPFSPTPPSPDPTAPTP